MLHVQKYAILGYRHEVMFYSCLSSSGVIFREAKRTERKSRILKHVGKKSSCRLSVGSVHRDMSETISQEPLVFSDHFLDLT